MEIKVEEFFKKSRAASELEESKKEMFVRLHQRECIVRLFDGTKFLLPMKMKVVDAARYGMAGASPPARAAPPPPSAARPPAGGAAARSMEAPGKERIDLPEPIIERELLERTRGSGPDCDGQDGPAEGQGGLAVYISDDGTTIIKRKRKLRKSEFRL